MIFTVFVLSPTLMVAKYKPDAKVLASIANSDAIMFLVITILPLISAIAILLTCVLLVLKFQTFEVGFGYTLTTFLSKVVVAAAGSAKLYSPVNLLKDTL